MKDRTHTVGLRAKLILSVLLLCGIASADTIIASGVDWSRGGSIAINENGSDINAYFAGVIYIQVSTGGQLFNRDSLCVDLFTDIYLGVTYDTTLLRPDQVPGKNLARVSWLVDNALLPTQDNSYGSALDPADWVRTSAQGAGIQLAIWDIVHDAGDGFSNGTVQAANSGGYVTDPTVLFWANTYETVSLGKQSDLAYIYQNVAQDANHTPAQMLAGPRFQDNGPAPIPEPATLSLTAAALAAGGWYARRRSRAK